MAPGRGSSTERPVVQSTSMWSCTALVAWGDARFIGQVLGFTVDTLEGLAVWSAP